MRICWLVNRYAEKYIQNGTICVCWLIDRYAEKKHTKRHDLCLLTCSLLRRKKLNTKRYDLRLLAYRPLR